MSFTSEKDFSVTKFDGGCRDSFQFVKYFYGVLEKERISSIINLKMSPLIKPPHDIIWLRDTHNAEVRTAKSAHDIAVFVQGASLASFNSAVAAISSTPGITEQQIKDQVDTLGPKPVLPVWSQPITQYTPHVAAQLENYKKELHRQDDTASMALSLLKGLCTPRLNDFCSAGVYDLEDKRPREKLLHMWEWIKNLRISDPSVINEVQDDIKNLPPIPTFKAAAANIAAINNLQRELTLMGSPYSDENLILLHANKLDGSDQFKHLRKQFLHSDHSRRLSTAPNMASTSTTSGGAAPTSFTWEDHCAEVQLWHKMESSTPQCHESIIVAHSATSSTLNQDQQKDTIESLAQQLKDLKEIMSATRSPTAPHRPTSETRRNERREFVNRNFIPREHYRRRMEDQQRFPPQNQQRSDQSPHRPNGGPPPKPYPRERQDTTRRERPFPQDPRYQQGYRPTQSPNGYRGYGNKRAYSAMEEDSFETHRDAEVDNDEGYIYPPDHDYVAMSAKGRLPYNDYGPEYFDQDDEA